MLLLLFLLLLLLLMLLLNYVWLILAVFVGVVVCTNNTDCIYGVMYCIAFGSIISDLIYYSPTVYVVVPWYVGLISCNII